MGIPDAGRTLVMGVVNVTPDSFSDGGRWFTPSAAVAHGLELLAQGADLLDVGGESTRPGARRVPVQDELDRVLPVIDGLVARGAVVSVDTTRAVVAREAVARGATLVNDVSGGLADDDMYGVVADDGRRVRRDALARPRGRHGRPGRLRRRRRRRPARAGRARRGPARGRVCATSRSCSTRASGFAKAGASNWPLLARLPELVADGFPVLVGASRKRFLGHLLAGADGEPAPPLARDGATAAVSALAAAAGAWCVRVHEVAGSADAVRVAAAWQAGREAGRHGQDRTSRRDEDELAVDEDARTGGSTR